MVLVSDLVLHNLGTGILSCASQLGHQTDWLIEHVRGTSQGIHCKTGLTLPEVFPDLQVRVDAFTSKDLHRVDVKQKQVVGGQRLFLLVDEWQEVDLSSHIVQSFECQMNVVVLLIRSLQLEKLPEECLFDILCIHSCVTTKHIVFFDDVDILVMSNQCHTVVET